MANHVLNTPSGIDVPIQSIQNYLYSKLSTWSPIEVFGRIYKHESENGYVAKSFIGGKDYLDDVYLNDTQNMHIFFIAGDESTTQNGILFSCELKVVCMVDLGKIAPNEKEQRVDTYMQSVLYNHLKRHRKLNISGVTTGIKNVMKGFQVEFIKKLDIQPLHTFAITGKINYYLNQNCK